MAKSDSPLTADVLEIYALCLLLGFRGRYSVSGGESARHRHQCCGKAPVPPGRPRALAPNWAPPKDAVKQKAGDPGVKGLLFGALGSFGLALVLFIAFKLMLISGASGLHSVAIH